MAILILPTRLGRDVAHEAVSLIEATLAPIFLVNGTAIFLNFTQARLFRVIDRIRALAPEPDDDTASERRRLVRRAVILRNSILMGVLVIAFTVLTTMLILLPSLMGQEFARPWPIYALTVALLCFAAALGLVVTDAFLSVGAVRHLARTPAK